MKAYCVKCKKMIEVKDGKVKKSKNGRSMMQGVCPHDGTKVNIFLPKNKS